MSKPDDRMTVEEVRRLAREVSRTDDTWTAAEVAALLVATHGEVADYGLPECVKHYVRKVLQQTEDTRAEIEATLATFPED